MKNVKEIKGLLYFRRKVGGKDTYIRLPAVDDPAFQEVYARLSKPGPPARRSAHAPRTIGALVEAYRTSADFRAISSVQTERNYVRYLAQIEAEDGHRTVAGVRPAFVYMMRDRMADTPGKANNWLAVFRVLMGYATRLDWRGDNPAAGLKALPVGEREPWPADLLRVCLEVASPMTRLLVTAALCTGQRNGDLIRMQHGWIAGGILSLRQAKTGVEVSIPVHPLLTMELAQHDRRSVNLFYDRAGRPFSSTKAVQSRIRGLMVHPKVQEVMADLIARESIPEDATFVIHGLRKNACCYLLELGMTDSEIGAMLGMSAAIVRHYGKRARALMIARDAAATFMAGDPTKGTGVIPFSRRG